ncbi:respiratory-chain NADH dehydrogenase [Lactifluus subvellereus]|nr:respiratory-chain NADH dehydrogenase [Lactifluus subvellereus]
MAILTHTMDEREKLMEFYECVSGTQLHAAYVHPGGTAFDLPHGLLNDIFHWATQFSSCVDEIEQVVTGNQIWKQRMISIGKMTAHEALDYSFSGIMLCGSGIKWDLRKVAPYDKYDEVEFDIPIGKNGDCYDRYLCRVQEFRESLCIIGQIFSGGYFVPLGEMYAAIEALKGEMVIYLVVVVRGAGREQQCRAGACPFTHVLSLFFLCPLLC